MKDMYSRVKRTNEVLMETLESHGTPRKCKWRGSQVLEFHHVCLMVLMANCPLANGSQ